MFKNSPRLLHDNFNIIYFAKYDDTMESNVSALNGNSSAVEFIKDSVGCFSLAFLR